MLIPRLSLGKDAPPSPKKVIRETVTYPRIRLTPDNDPCLNPSMSYDHVLVCGHVIATPMPDEPCAPNCHHIAINRSSKQKTKTDTPKKVKAMEFYCEACVETENEALIPDDIASTAAELMRLEKRQIEADKRGKQKNFRRCYIGLKVTSVPCHSDGTLRGRYTPRPTHHHFDTAIPQAGDNFFEDMTIDPSDKPDSIGDDSATVPQSTGGTDVNSSPTNLGEGGADWLRYTQSIAQKTPKPGPPRRNPIVQNSDTALPVLSPQQSRKRSIVIDEDDDYVDTPEEDVEVVKRPAKRHRKPIISTPTTPATKKKTSRPMKPMSSTPAVSATKQKKKIGKPINNVPR